MEEFFLMLSTFWHYYGENNSLHHLHEKASLVTYSLFSYSHLLFSPIRLPSFPRRTMEKLGKMIQMTTLPSLLLRLLPLNCFHHCRHLCCHLLLSFFQYFFSSLKAVVEAFCC